MAEPSGPDAPAVPPDDVRIHSKVSPHLRAVAFDWARRNRESAQPAPAPAVRVLIELAGTDTSELAASGIAFAPLFGTFYSARIPLDKLDDIARLPSVIHIHHEAQTKPGLDDSIPEIRASSVRNPQYPFSGTDKYTGLGVMIGIIDSGINILHPVFRLPNDQTKTRIRTILDQTVNPTVTYNKGQIEAAIASGTQIIQPGAMVGGNRVETDTNDHKHGTHVAGIAAGNGKKAGNCSGEFKYVGVAPDAELVIVKHDFAGQTTLQAAIQFIAATAAAVQPDPVPVVINMSLGHSIGPHDGTDPMDQMIDTFLSTHTGPPVVLVASAGNEGGQGKHATGTIPPGGVVKRLHFELNAQKSVKGQATTRIDIRFTAANGLGCKLVPPGNNIQAGGSNVAAPDAPASSNFVEANKNSSCTIIPTLLNAGTGARRIFMSMSSGTKAEDVNQPGGWVIELTNAGAAAIAYHAWIDGDQWEELKDDVSRANTVGSPGSAARIITVGNYASSGKDKGKLSDSSSRGPRLDGMQKPDVSAPGEEICSAKRDLHTGCCCDCCCDSYIDMSGTSMAAPHVTGAIALMLERNSTLTHDQVKSVLLANARRDSFTGANPGNDFGNGKLDAIALLNDPLVRGSGTVISSSRVTVRRAAPKLAERAAQALPEIPQLQEGTPLWRLLDTREGRRLYGLARTHWEEVRELVNTEKRVAVAWHRNQGPMLLHHATRTAMLPHVPLPAEWDGVEAVVHAARMVTALEPYASKELIKAMHATLPLVRSVQGRTLLELVEMFEASEALEDA